MRKSLEADNVSFLDYEDYESDFNKARTHRSRFMKIYMHALLILLYTSVFIYVTRARQASPLLLSNGKVLYPSIL